LEVALLSATSVVLDTSAYSALHRGHPGVHAALSQTEAVFLTPIVLGELRAGFRSGSFLEKNEQLLSQFIALPSVKVTRIDAETAARYAQIQHYLRKNGRPIPTNDLWIAASAMQLGARVLTTDEHFLAIPQILTLCVRPTKPPGSA
jgi:tRNA(fMet)-specific endonuclease VapC